MTHNARTKLFIVVVVVFLLAFLPALFLPTDVADAVLPESYIKDVTEWARDWYAKDGFLDIDNNSALMWQWYDSARMQAALEPIKQDPIVVAVIDTGLNVEHELFTGKYDADGVPTSDAAYDVLLRDGDGNVVRFNSYSSGRPQDITDDQGHGSHVAGIIAMLIHSFDLEQYIKILPIKASYTSGGKSYFIDTDTGEALAFAREHGADVVNMSFGGYTKPSASSYSITEADAQKAVYVASAGNGDSNASKRVGLDSADRPCYPAAFENVIGVMNYERSGSNIRLSSTSNYGDAYQLAAPGTEVWSANSATTDEYKSLNGTSMASPVVAFAAALAIFKDRVVSQVLGTATHNMLEIAEQLKASYSSTIRQGSREIKVLDLSKIVYDATIKLGANTPSGNAKLGQNMKLVFSVLPENLKQNGSVTWYEGDEQIGEGFELNYVPHSVGVNTLKAVYSGSGDVGVVERTYNFFVDYLEITQQNIGDVRMMYGGKPISEISLYPGGSYIISLNVAEYVDPEVMKTVTWYVNGTYADAGSTFRFVPSETGTYTIYARIRSLAVKSVTLHVVSGDRPLPTKNMLTIVTIALSATIGGIIVIAVTIIIIKHRRR